VSEGFKPRFTAESEFWPPSGSADTIAVDNAAVYVGGAFSSVNRVAQSYLATFPIHVP
jgi:hypothetical protein